MGKRKGETMRDKISEMAKKVKSDNSSSSEEEKATHDYKKEVEEFNGGADKNDILEDETKENYLKRILEHSKNADIYFEYLMFLRKLPTMINSVKDDLVKEVEQELNIQHVKANLNTDDKVSQSSKSNPILNALNAKLEKSVSNILAAPINYMKYVGLSN